MFLADKAQGEPPACHSCRSIIGYKDETRTVRFDDPQLTHMNGLYHAACAKPIVTLQDALEMIDRVWGW